MLYLSVYFRGLDSRRVACGTSSQVAVRVHRFRDIASPAAVQSTARLRTEVAERSLTHTWVVVMYSFLFVNCVELIFCARCTDPYLWTCHVARGLR